MRSNAHCLLIASAVTTTTLFAARSSLANTSNWATRVGYIYTDDSTTWCEPSLTTSGAQSSFRLVPSDSSQSSTSPVTSTVAEQMVRVQCSFLGNTVVESSGWSTGQATVSCPAFYAPSQPECSIKGQVNGAPATLPYVYQASACGSGVASINTSTLVAELLYDSTLTGGSEFLTYGWNGLNTASPLGMPNKTHSVSVGGADLGAVFMQAGMLNFAFGDTCTEMITSVVNGQTQYQCGDLRSGSLAKSTSLDPSGGIILGPWETFTSSNGTVKAGPTFARATGEVTAVPGAGFAITAPGGSETRYLWYISVNGWSPFVANYAGLATSVGGATVQGTEWNRAQGPRWPANSNFGPGAVWQDRYNQWIYFFGVRPQIEQPNGLPYSGVRVARVRSDINAVTDPTQYYYWGGAARGWVQDSVGAYAPAIPAAQGGSFGPEADLVPVSTTTIPRSEISVSFNAFANVWMMMFLNQVDQGIRLYVASSITGPWVEVWFDTFNLPNPGPLPNGQSGAHGLAGVYAPFLSDHMQLGAGSDMYYLASEYFPVYNVGEWHFTVNRNTTCSLTP